MRASAATPLALLAALSLPTTARAQQRDSAANAPIKAQEAPPLRFEYLGPENGGRISAFAGIPGDTMTYYAGAASGGVWKSTDGAKTFTPIFDEEPVQAIGTLAVSPSAPSVVWAGTGEAWAIRDADIIGDGVYRSADAGATWQNMGLAASGRIGRIIVHPTNPNIVFVCALGQITGPSQERGVFRTDDGGRTWKRVLFVNPETGCSGLALDPHDPSVLFAGMWQVVMHPWAMLSGGPGSGVFVSRDGGATWNRVVSPGLPKSPVGKVDVAIAPSDSRRIYALIETANQGSLWRSDDGGRAWRSTSWDRRLIGRAGYYIRLAVNPANEDEVLVANSSLLRSTDGGVTFALTDRGCGDCHDIWMDPLAPDHWATTGDGGVGITLDHAKTFRQVSLPVAQSYHVAVDDRTPYWVYSNRQDDGTMRGPSDAPAPVPNVPSYYRGLGVGTGIPGGGAAPRPGAARAAGGGGFFRPRPAESWQGPLGGCESGFTLPMPGNPDVVWASCYGNTVTRYDAKTGEARSVSPWIHTLDWPPNEAKYRCHWTPPLAIDPFDPNTVYYGCQVVFRTSDGGQSWSVISPDLSSRDSSRIVPSGGLNPDNLGQFYGEVVFAIAPSPLRKGLIWAGTNDGRIWNTTDAGAHWTDVTANVHGMPAWGSVRRIDPSPFDSSTAYVAVDAHLMGDRAPYVFKTTDLGRTWTKISATLPANHPLSYVMSVAENPNRRGMLFAGTGHAFYYSMDDGRSWTQFSRGLPAAPVSWIAPVKDYHDVVVSTYGRGLFVLRDIARLEQAETATADTSAFLYQPSPGIRRPRTGSAEFLYTLAAAPRKPVEVDVLDGRDSVVRKLKVLSYSGLNRVHWDLRYDPPRQVAFRTPAPDDPHIWEGGRFLWKETRPVDHWGIQGTQRAGPIAAPGAYTVRLTLNGRKQTRPLMVLKDPRITAPDSDLVASTRAQVRIRALLDTTVDMINRIEKMREQAESQRAGKPADVAEALARIDSAMSRVELQLVSRANQESDDKWFTHKPAIYMQLIWLSGEVGLGAGDVAGGADHRPTDASLAWLAEMEGKVTAAQAQFRTLLDQEVPAFNQRMAGKVTPIATTDKKPAPGAAKEPEPQADPDPHY